MKSANDYVCQATARRARTSDHANPRPYRGVKTLGVLGVDRWAIAGMRPRNSENFFSPAALLITAVSFNDQPRRVRQNHPRNSGRGGYGEQTEGIP